MGDIWCLGNVFEWHHVLDFGVGPWWLSKPDDSLKRLKSTHLHTLLMLLLIRASTRAKNIEDKYRPVTVSEHSTDSDLLSSVFTVLLPSSFKT